MQFATDQHVPHSSQVDGRFAASTRVSSDNQLLGQVARMWPRKLGAWLEDGLDNTLGAIMGAKYRCGMHFYTPTLSTQYGGSLLKLLP
jgi:hypothetical protein